MGPPKITCWVESEDKVRCSKGESAIEQFFPIQGIYYGFEKGKLNNWTSIENFLVDETISLDAKNPKDVIYYQFLYKDKNKSEILFEELIK